MVEAVEAEEGGSDGPELNVGLVSQADTPPGPASGFSIPEEFKAFSEFNEAKSMSDMAGVYKSQKDRMAKGVTAEDLPALAEKYRPPSSADYKYDLDQYAGNGLDMDLDAKFREAAHKASLSNSQASDMANMYAEFMGGAASAKEDAQNSLALNTSQTLKTMWGDGIDGRLEEVSVGLKALGQDKAMQLYDAGLLRINEKLGQGELLSPVVAELLADYGARRVEGGFVGGSSSGTSVEAAQQAIKDKNNDPAFIKRLTSDDGRVSDEARAEILKYHNIVSGVNR